MLQALWKPQHGFERTTSWLLPPWGSRLVRESRTGICSNIGWCELLLVQGQSSSQACCIVSSLEHHHFHFKWPNVNDRRLVGVKNPSFSSLPMEMLHKMKSCNLDAIKLSRENVGQYLLTSLSLDIDRMSLPSTEVCKLYWTVVCCEG